MTRGNRYVGKVPMCDETAESIVLAFKRLLQQLTLQQCGSLHMVTRTPYDSALDSKVTSADTHMIDVGTRFIRRSLNRKHERAHLQCTLVQAKDILVPKDPSIVGQEKKRRRGRVRAHVDRLDPLQLATSVRYSKRDFY